jgi:hypothetical protein
MDEDVAWGRGSDDAFGDTGVRTSQPEDLRNGGYNMVNFERQGNAYLGGLALSRVLEKLRVGGFYGF